MSSSSSSSSTYVLLHESCCCTVTSSSSSWTPSSSSSSSSLFTSLSLVSCPLCGGSVPLCTRNREAKFQLWWMLSLSRDAPKCRAGLPALLEVTRPWQSELWSTQWALSVLCGTPVLRSTPCLGAEWGVQVLFVPPTPPQDRIVDRIAGILSTHVRCSLHSSGMFKTTTGAFSRARVYRKSRYLKSF